MRLLLGNIYSATSGWKTYIVCALVAAYSIAAYLLGDITSTQFVAYLGGAAAAAGLRDGISTAGK